MERKDSWTSSSGVRGRGSEETRGCGVGNAKKIEKTEGFYVVRGC